MLMRKCGKSDIRVSIIGVGCWSYGGGADDYWGAQDQQAVNDVVSAALDMGINHFDTAEQYNEGRSEEALGAALKGRRDQAVIASKIWLQTPEQLPTLRERAEASLRRLGTDYLDFYYVHWPVKDAHLHDVLAVFDELKSEGKVRSVCLSNHGVGQIAHAVRSGVQIDLNQLCYNLLSRAIEVEIMPLCARHNIGVVAYMPLMQGLLAGKYANADEVPPNRRRTRHFRGDIPPARHGGPGFEREMFAVIDRLREICAEHEISMADLSMAWVLQHSGIASTLIGVRDVEQLKQAVATTEISLDQELKIRLDELTRPLLKAMGTNPDYWESLETSRSH
ncbi:MAG: aldo/keto reductase [candidate division WS1 bacterium]|nr:aldo/keto reductase [candidate division WS1 bacterium]